MCISKDTEANPRLIEASDLGEGPLSARDF